MDLLQILLAAVVVILTGLLGYIGVQVVLILKDFRKTLKRLDEIVGDSHELFTSVTRPLTNFSNLLGAISSLGEWVKGVGEKGKGKDGKKRLVVVEESEGENGRLLEGREEESEGGSGPPEHISTVRKRGREVAGKFFHKRGRSLVG